MTKVITRGLKLSKEEYYITHLSIINPVLPLQLTNKEIEVLAAFMALDPAITEGNTFNSFARKKVKNFLSLSAGGLGNYLKSMTVKGFLIKEKNTNKVSIRKFLIPENGWQGYQFKIEITDD